MRRSSGLCFACGPYENTACGAPRTSLGPAPAMVGSSQALRRRSPGARRCPQTLQGAPGRSQALPGAGASSPSAPRRSRGVPGECSRRSSGALRRSNALPAHSEDSAPPRASGAPALHGRSDDVGLCCLSILDDQTTSSSRLRELQKFPEPLLRGDDIYPDGVSRRIHRGKRGILWK